jgi:hypothetical protein
MLTRRQGQTKRFPSFTRRIRHVGINQTTPAIARFWGAVDYPSEHPPAIKEPYFCNAHLSVSWNLYESVGKTGSGADHIWPALDYVPPWANLLYLDVALSGTNASTGGDKHILLRMIQNSHNEIYTDNTMAQAKVGNAVAAELQIGLLRHVIWRYEPAKYGLFQTQLQTQFTSTSAVIWLKGIGQNADPSPYVGVTW